jgi:hypothetical protein
MRIGRASIAGPVRKLSKGGLTLRHHDVTMS